MKKLILILLLLPIGVIAGNPIKCDSVKILRDSINKMILNKENFIKAYKYSELYKYYRICKKNPKQWKYYKGWSIRVFEQ